MQQFAGVTSNASAILESDSLSFRLFSVISLVGRNEKPTSTGIFEAFDILNLADTFDPTRVGSKIRRLSSTTNVGPETLSEMLEWKSHFRKREVKEILTEWDVMISYSFIFLQIICSSKMMESSKASEGTQASAESLKECRVTPNSLRGRSAIWIHTSWREPLYKEKTSTLEENMQP